MFSVYILQSEKDNKYYIGCTSDVEKRIDMHNKGSVRSTKSRVPFRLIHEKVFKTFTEARKRENVIKGMKGGIQFKDLIKMRG